MIFEELQDIIADQFSISKDEITPETSFVDDLNADSLDLVELTMKIEEEFDLPEISDEDLAGLLTVEDAVNYITSKTE